MRIRGLLATTALATSTLFGLPATAEEPDACLLLEDAANDTTYQGRPELAGFLVQPDVDILSADVATDGERLYATIRVQSLRGGTPLRAGEAKYRLEFASASRRYYVQMPYGYPVSVSTYPYRWPWATAGRVGGRAYQVWAWTDYSNNEIYVEAPLYVFGNGSLVNGTVVRDLRASAERTYSDNGQLAPGVGSRISVTDLATSQQTYVAGSASCITPAAPVFEPVPAEPAPTPEPSPSAQPTPSPTGQPTPSHEPSPTAQPTAAPTSPTGQPTEPTAQPTPSPAP